MAPSAAEISAKPIEFASLLDLREFHEFKWKTAPTTKSKILDQTKMVVFHSHFSQKQEPKVCKIQKLSKCS